jgi:hypothetical protein
VSKDKAETLKELAEVDKVLDTALKKLPSFVPQEHRVPTPGGGSVLQLATAILVVGKAVVAGLRELEGE